MIHPLCQDCTVVGCKDKESKRFANKIILVPYLNSNQSNRTKTINYFLTIRFQELNTQIIVRQIILSCRL